MTQEQYEKEKDLIMAEYINDKQSIVEECGKRLATIEKNYKDAEDGFRAAGRRYSDSTIEIKNWFDYELAELKKQVLKEEAASSGGLYEIDEIRNRHSERVTELIEKRYEKLDGIDIEWCAAKVAFALATRERLIDTRNLETIRRKAIDEAKKVRCENLKELARKMQEEGSFTYSLNH